VLVVARRAEIRQHRSVATTLTEAGHVGEDVETIILKL
jgi:ATP-dependent protease Clp ATPase subunit